MCARVRVYVRACMCVYMCARAYLRAWVIVCACVCACLCACVRARKVVSSRNNIIIMKHVSARDTKSVDEGNT